MNLIQRLRSLREDEEVSEHSYEIAHELLNWAAMPYFKTFCEYLDREASKRYEIGNHLDMVKDAARANAYREIREDITRDIRRAEALIARARES